MRLALFGLAIVLAVAAEKRMRQLVAKLDRGGWILWRILDIGILWYVPDFVPISLTQELRASISLARLWHRQGNSTAARALLDDVMQRFPDPDHSRDYRCAAHLMQTLPAPAPDR